MKKLLEISKEDLLKELKKYYEIEVESCPLNTQAFIDVLFGKYTQKSTSSLQSCE